MNDTSLWLAVCRCPPCLDRMVKYDPDTGKASTIRVFVELTRTGNGKADMKILDTVKVIERSEL